MRKTEYQKMLAGELYEANNTLLFSMRKHAKGLLHAYNQTLYNKNKGKSCYENC